MDIYETTVVFSLSLFAAGLGIVTTGMAAGIVLIFASVPVAFLGCFAEYYK